MLTTYTTDGSQTRYTFNWPYLDRSHIMVTRDGAPALFKFLGDYEVEVKTLFGAALPAGEVLKIFRVTPDLIGFAEFHDSANLTQQDLNRVSASAIEISSASRTLTRGWSWFRWEPAVDNYRLDASVGPPFLEPIVGIPEPSGEAPSSATSLT